MQIFGLVDRPFRQTDPLRPGNHSSLIRRRAGRRRTPVLELLESRRLLTAPPATTTNFADSVSGLTPYTTATDQDGNVYFSGTGYTAKDSNGNGYVSIAGLQSQAANSAAQTGPSSFVAKTDDGGFGQWVGAFLGLTHLRIAVDASDNVYVLGDTQGDPATYLPPPNYGGGRRVGNPAGETMVEVLKLNSNGQYQWGDLLTGPTVQAGAIAVDNRGDVVVACEADSTVSFSKDYNQDPNFETDKTQILTGSNYDFVVKLDPTGALIWKQGVLGVNDDVNSPQTRIAVDASDNVYLTDTDTADTTIGTTTFAPASGNSITFLAELQNLTGNVVWATAVGQGPSIVNQSVAVDGAGNAYVAGTFAGSMSLQGDSGYTSALPATVASVSVLDDIYVTVFGPSGTLTAVKTYGEVGTDQGLALASDGLSEIVLGGTYQNTINLGGTTLPSTATDLFVAQLDPQGNILWAQSSGGQTDDIYTLSDVSLNGTNAALAITGTLTDNSKAASFGGDTLLNSGLLAAELNLDNPSVPQLTSLPAQSHSTTIPLAWSASFAAGVTYDVLVSTDGGPLIPWLIGTSQRQATYTGSNGHSYGFAVVAVNPTDDDDSRLPTGATSADTTAVVLLQAATTTALQASPAQPVVGQPVTFTATVSTASGTPTGTVTFTIDGTQEPPVAVGVSGGADIAAFPDPALGVGPHTISATYNGDTNFAPSTVTQPLMLTVSPFTPTLQLTATGGTYSGAPFPAMATVSEISGGPADSNLLTYSYSGTTDAGPAYGPSASAPTEAGSYTVTASVAGGGDYAAATSTPAPFVIAQATPVITVADNGATTPATATKMVTGVSGGAADNNPVTFSYSGTTFAGASYGPTAAAPSANGNYSVTATVAAGGDYAAATSLPVSFTIGEAMPMIGIVDQGGVYNGSPFPAAATVMGAAGAGGDNNPVTYSFVGTTTAGLAYGPTASAPTEAGVYTASATVAAGGVYGAATATVPFTISQATPGITVVESGSGGPATVTVTGVTGAAADNNLITDTYTGTSAAGAPYGPSSTPPATAGSYSVTASVAAGGDYRAATSAPVAFTIATQVPAINVTDNGGTYNGGAYPAMVTVNGGSGGPPDNNAVTITYTGTTRAGLAYGPSVSPPEDAGNYTVAASVAAGGDYGSATSSPVPFTISPAIPTVSLAESGGSSQVIATVTGVTGGAPDLNLITYSYSGTITGGSAYGPSAIAPTAPGTYTVTASVAAGGDYAAATAAPFTLSLSKTTPAVQVQDNGGTFTGNSFPATATVTGTDGVAEPSLDGVAPTLAYFAGTSAGGTPLAGPPTTAGTYFALASFAGSAHFTATSSGTRFVIGQAMPVLNVTASNVSYSGAPVTATATIAGAPGVAGSALENVAPTLSYYAGGVAIGTPLAGAPAGAGSYAVVASFAGSTDYLPAQVSTRFSIAPATPVISWAQPADIPSGTPLGPAQLDATASTPGSFTYSPSAGTVLSSGQGQVLTVTFAAADRVDYTIVIGSTVINVMPPPATPPQMMTVSAVGSKKGVTTLTINFNESLNASSAGNRAQYQVVGGVTKVVKKHHVTVFSKHLVIKSVTPSSGGSSVTVTLAKPYKGVVQVTTLAGLMAANGASSTSASTMNAS